MVLTQGKTGCILLNYKFNNEQSGPLVSVPLNRGIFTIVAFPAPLGPAKAKILLFLHQNQHPSAQG